MKNRSIKIVVESNWLWGGVGRLHLIDYLINLEIVDEILPSLHLGVLNITNLVKKSTFSEKNMGHFFPLKRS